MATSSQTHNAGQLSAATALMQLLTEHPELPVASWQIGSIVPDLHGSLYGGLESLAEYVFVLGGKVEAAGESFELRGQRVRRHALRTVWRDVPVEVGVLVPAVVPVVTA